jgi:hypothetical protein
MRFLLCDNIEQCLTAEDNTMNENPAASLYIVQGEKGKENN